MLHLETVASCNEKLAARYLSRSEREHTTKAVTGTVIDGDVTPGSSPDVLYVKLARTVGNVHAVQESLMPSLLLTEDSAAGEFEQLMHDDMAGFQDFGFSLLSKKHRGKLKFMYVKISKVIEGQEDVMIRVSGPGKGWMNQLATPLSAGTRIIMQER